MENKTLLEVFDEIKEKDLDFLPNDEAKEGFMVFLRFITLAS